MLNHPDIYNVDAIIEHARITQTDISPNDRQDWVFFGVALRVLGHPQTTFAALSWSDPKTQAECRRVWDQNRSVRMDESKAKAKIVALAKDAGIDVKQFLLSPTSTRGHRSGTPRPVKRVAPPPEPTLPPVFVSLDEVTKAAMFMEQTTLYNFLCRYFPRDEVSRVFADYLVGATKEFGNDPGYGCAFPYINHKGQCVDVHLQPYEIDGHRWKEEQHPRTHSWRLAKLKQKDRRLKRVDGSVAWPLFGEHLLPSRPNTPVAVVEAEKSALVGALVAPQYVWVACQGMQNLPKRLVAAKDRDCFLFPDLDGIEAWEKQGQKLADDGYRIFMCSDFIRQYAPSPKGDIADIAISNLKPSKI